MVIGGRVIAIIAEVTTNCVTLVQSPNDVILFFTIYPEKSMSDRNFKCNYRVTTLPLQRFEVETNTVCRLSAIAYSIFATKLGIWRPSPPSATREDATWHGDRNPRMEFIFLYYYYYYYYY